MRVSIIVAMTPSGVIGRGGDLPWRLSADLQRFKRLTMGHPMVMGRKTWESIGRPLPGRESIVVTRQPDYAIAHESVRVAASLTAALELDLSQANVDISELFIIGGGEIYREALPTANRLYVTRVQAEVVGDTHFPDVDWSEWSLDSSEKIVADDRNEFETTFEVWSRA